MKQVNIHEAKTQLSKLINDAINGEPFTIAKAGKPLVIVSRIDKPKAVKRLGAISGLYSVPDDFDSIGQKEIESLFGVSE